MVEIISYVELKKLIDSNSEFVLIDVREPVELVHGMIPTAKNIPLSEFESAFEMKPDMFKKKYGVSIDKSIPWVVHCRRGKRSAKASEFLEKKGFNVRSFGGSIEEWALHDSNVKMYEMD